MARTGREGESYTDGESLLPIAEALREAIDAKLAGEWTSGPVDVDAAYDAALSAVAEEIIASRLGALDPMEVLRLYAERVGDDALREQLGRWAAAKADELDSAHRLEGLRRQANRSGRLVFESLGEGVRLKIALFEPLQISQAHRDSSVPPARTIEVRLIEPARGRADVVSDTPLRTGAHERLPAHARGTIGSLVVEVDRRWLEPALQLHGPLGYDFGAGVAATPEVIGFVDLADGLPVLG